MDTLTQEVMAVYETTLNVQWRTDKMTKPNLDSNHEVLFG